MRRNLFRVCCAAFLLFGMCSCGETEVTTGSVVINGRELSERELQDFKARYGARPRAGRWWYDAMSGLFGVDGGPALGFMFPGHDFGTLSELASGPAGTGVFINGRELPVSEWAIWTATFGNIVLPGRYWLDGAANYGVEGLPMPLGNLLLVLANRRGGRQGGGGGDGGDNFWSTRFSAGNSTADGSAGYVSVPGVGPVSYGM
jgi:hypothetical protein